MHSQESSWLSETEGGKEEEGEKGVGSKGERMREICYVTWVSLQLITRKQPRLQNHFAHLFLIDTEHCATNHERTKTSNTLEDNHSFPF